MKKLNRHIWEEDSTHRSVAGNEYDEVWDYAEQLEAENERLRKIVARAINMLDMFADKSRGKYADEARIVSNELFKMLKALGDEG